MADVELKAFLASEEACERQPRRLEHRCRIDTITEGRYYPGNPGYLVVCDVCGPDLRPVNGPREAQRIANAHEKASGYAR